jgi:hypothetical protein
MASLDMRDKVYENSIIITKNTQNNDKQAGNALAQRPVRHAYLIYVKIHHSLLIQSTGT